VLGHDGFFGNPFRVTKARTREQAIASFEAHARERIATDATFRDGVRALYGRRLFCWCSSPDNPQPCHAEALERLACELAESERMASEGGPA
jgi:hypothetical protein